MPAGDELEVGLHIDVKEAERELRWVLGDMLIEAVDFVVTHFKTIIIEPLILGGKGWKPFVQTSSWRWINSPKGYGQLGFSNAAEPNKLLHAILASWEVKKVVRFNPNSENMYIGLIFRFADLGKLRQATIHPAAGRGKLPSDASWFDWIYKGVAMPESGFHFRRTGPIKGSRSSAIAGPEAGLMKPGGFWQVTPRFRFDLDRLIEVNENKIAITIQHWLQTRIAELSRA